MLASLTTLQRSALAEGFTPLSEPQRRLLERGLDAHERQDYDRAISLFQNALNQNRVNILHLNLGRAYQKRGCNDARSALIQFNQIDTAPMVDDPRPALVTASGKKYVEELYATCGATLDVQCVYPATTLIVDGQPTPCQKPVKILSGDIPIQANAGGYISHETVSLSPGEVRSIFVNVKRPYLETVSSTGWALVGTGAAAFSSGLVFSVLANNTNRELRDLALNNASSTIDRRIAKLSQDAETFEFVQYVTLGAGVALITSGLLFFHHDQPLAQSSTKRPGLAPDFTLSASPRSVGLHFKTGF